MAKYSLPEMFGQLPDLVSQGFSTPEDILSIGSTGQPEDDIDPYAEFMAGMSGNEEASLPDTDIFGSVLEATGDPMLANMAAQNTASDALVQAMLTDLTPSENELRMQSAVNAVMPMYGNPDFYDKTIDEFAKVYGVDANRLSREVERVRRQEEVSTKPWFQGKDMDTIETRMTSPIQVMTIDPTRSRKDLTVNVDVGPTNNPGSVPVDRDETSFLNPPTLGAKFPDLLKEFWNFMETQRSATPDMRDYVSDEDTETDKIIEDITSLQKPDPSQPPEEKSVSTTTTVTAGTPGHADLMGKMSGTGPDKFQYLYDQDGANIYIDQQERTIYSKRGSDINMLGRLRNSYNSEGINYFELIAPDGNPTQDLFYYDPQFNEYKRQRQTTTAGIVPTTVSPTGGMHALAGDPQRQWDAIRAREMGDEVYNPVMWGARRYGFRPAFGQFLLSGGMVDGQAKPFYEWLPSSEDRDSGSDWSNLLKASELYTNPSGWADTSLGSLPQRIYSSMQGDAAKTNIINMVSTALGAGEGYTSDALRGSVANWFDVYAAQAAAEGKPIGGFVDWLDDRMNLQSALPVSNEVKLPRTI